ncbi:MAG: DUF1566 domain-containing protein, partial [Anaerolineae bacterium]|nr:DUF1566 domain-containing protein [Anaerolineae bacterium]
ENGAYVMPAWRGERFTDNGNGTVRDNMTGLIWLKNANCYDRRTWETALLLASILADGSCGLSDGSASGNWRLPNLNELHSLIDLSQSAPAMPAGHSFIDVQTGVYWSSTTSTPNRRNIAWNVYLYTGGVYDGYKTFTNYVWPVRGGQ